MMVRVLKSMSEGISVTFEHSKWELTASHWLLDFMHWWHHCLATQSCSSGLCSLIFKFSEGQSGKYPKNYLSKPVPWTLMIDFNFNVRLPCADFSLISTWKCSWVEAFSVWCNTCIGLWLPQEPCVHPPRYGEVAPPWIGSSSQCSECIEGWGKPSSELFLSTSTPPPCCRQPMSSKATDKKTWSWLSFGGQSAGKPYFSEPLKQCDIFQCTLKLFTPAPTYMKENLPLYQN